MCNNFHNIHISIQIDNKSALVATNKMDSTRLIDMNQVVHLIWNFILKHDNWVTMVHIPGVLNEEADIDQGSTGLAQSG